MDDSSSPRAVVEGLYAAFAEGDDDRMRGLLADGLRWRQAARAVPAAGVAATGTYRGVFRATGRPLTAEFCHLWTVEDGRITAFRQYTDTAAFAAATTA